MARGVVFLGSSRRRRLSATAAALAVTAVTTTWAVGANPARAGGVQPAQCPSGTLEEVSAAYHDFIDSHPDIALRTLTQLADGYYAEAGRYWPPATSILCSTESDPGQPTSKTDGQGCPADWLPFDIPVSIGPDATVTWGTFVPAGFYTRAVPTGTGDPDWVTLCRAPADLAPLT